MSSHASFAPSQSLSATKPIGGAATTNDIVSAHKSGKKKQSTAARLNALVDQFQAFYGGLEHDVIQKSGSWYSYGDIRIGQGRDATKQWLRDEEGYREEVKQKVKEALGMVPVAPTGEDVGEDELVDA